MRYTKINLKPLSVNKAWQGKRYKTNEYLKFERNCLQLLPVLNIGSEKLCITIEYGFSNTLSDIDNPTKMILDILQKRYNFNDNQIYKLVLYKNIVKKENEYFAFFIENYLEKSM
jgi:Holliday junction resolvase RusA-like endonuclease